MTSQPPTDSERADIAEMTAATGLGHFTAGYLNKTHSRLKWLKDEEPMHPVRLGQVLAEMGYIPKTKWDGTKARKPGKRPGYMVKGWII